MLQTLRSHYTRMGPELNLPIRGTPSSPPAGTQPAAVPAIGSYGSCLAVTPHAGCPQFTDGVVNVRVVSVDKPNHQIIFEVKKCDGFAFNSPSTLYVYKGLCGGTQMGGVNFPATVYTYQVTLRAGYDRNENL